MHLDDERLQRLLDGELTAEAERSVRAHLDACAACRERVAEVRREESELQGLLRRLDHPAPPMTPADLARRPRPWIASGVRRAAAILLAAGLAGAAYALPGSPVRGWLAQVAERLAGPPEPQTPAPHRQAEDPGVAGIAVPPGARLVVSFDSAQARGEAVVTVTAGAAEVTVRAPAGAATYDAGLDRLVIGNGGSGASYAIEIPADAPWVEIRVAGRRIFLKQDSLMTAKTDPSADGRFRLQLTR